MRPRARILTLPDQTSKVWRAEDLFPNPSRDPSTLAAKLAEQFVRMNKDAFRALGISAEVITGAKGPRFKISTSGIVGALALRSPISGKSEWGVLVEPRFGWAGMGPMLCETGAAVVPEILRAPLLPQSLYQIPSWVIASTVVSRLEMLMREPTRKFVLKNEVLPQPRGRVDWGAYARHHIARGTAMRVPCTYPNLGDDELLLAGVHASVLKHMQSLASLQDDRRIVSMLLERFDRVRRLVEHIAPRWVVLDQMPKSSELSGSRHDALEAMGWTKDDRGLAGLAPQTGLPWRLSMDIYFEIWVERVVQAMVRSHGGVVTTGRAGTTVRPLDWTPNFAGSQRSLRPDTEWRLGERCLIVDAKYKRHWEELDQFGRHALSGVAAESHRHDLLQALAYSTASDAINVTSVLMYPCTSTTWQSLLERGRIAHVAEVPSGRRRVRLILCAVPMEGSPRDIAEMLASTLLAA